MKTNQVGRSMVEMLGVLAIIGVLSVGAIAGYSKAMFKHKQNKTMDIISYALSRIAELETMKLGDEIMGAEDAKKYGIFPNCDVNYVNQFGLKGYSCSMPLGEVNIDFMGGNGKIQGALSMYFLIEPVDSCIAFLSSGVYKNVPEGWWYNMDENNLGGYIGVNAKFVYAKNNKMLLEGAKSEITAQDILDACESCKTSDYCNIEFVIRDEF